ncbi:class I SAM-dependent methyltransferase [Marinivivus vitaminiproducens]|uniref:class I SAM-dependent methyltransferase n=1 Tax=Marinivivus vitaminiproducens TaxID=3035935 RepID=UPI00279A8579|nr:class I SAM-dependent methyltransferase [Geminicoccaceae bacterium SCSIO 64248]
MPTEDGAQQFMKAFSDPEAVARYTDGPRRFVPGFAELHRMTGIVLAERAPADARVLVLGAGGGLEMKALADVHPGWRFVGVDPSLEMLRLAERTLGRHAARAELVHGYVEDAPPGPFDAATCLLTLHFVDAAERRRMAGEIRRRLKPGAPIVVAHGCLPRESAERTLWLARYAAFAVASGVEPEQAENARSTVDASVNMLPPEEDERVLREAGFSDVSLFYAAFTWRGWVARA